MAAVSATAVVAGVDTGGSSKTVSSELRKLEPKLSDDDFDEATVAEVAAASATDAVAGANAG